MLEWYEAYADYEDIAARCEQLVASVAASRRLRGRVRLRAAVAARDAGRARSSRATGDRHPRATATSTRCAPRCASAGLEVPSTRRPGPQLVDHLLSKYVEPELIQPTFLIDYPVELSPFAKRHRTEHGLVERFEVFAGGMEFANAFTELNDPDDQRARFEEQRAAPRPATRRPSRSTRPTSQALEHGMPPTGGIGIGIDRLVMLLTGRDTIREVVLFPAMRD